MARSKLIDRDLGWKDLKAKVKAAGKVAVKVGLLQDSGHHPDGTSLVEAAVGNEFGTSDGRIPERPAWRQGIDGNEKKLVTALRRTATEVVDRDLPADIAIRRVGHLAQAIIRKSIVDLDDPPNAPATIAAKGSSNPLIDSGHTRQAVTFEVLTQEAVDAARQASTRDG